MPYDTETADILAGPNNTDGQEISLFVSGNNIITLHLSIITKACIDRLVRTGFQDPWKRNSRVCAIEEPYFPDGTGPSIEDVSDVFKRGNRERFENSNSIPNLVLRKSLHCLSTSLVNPLYRQCFWCTKSIEYGVDRQSGRCSDLDWALHIMN